MTSSEERFEALLAQAEAFETHIEIVHQHICDQAARLGQVSSTYKRALKLVADADKPDLHLEAASMLAVVAHMIPVGIGRDLIMFQSTQQYLKGRDMSRAHHLSEDALIREDLLPLLRVHYQTIKDICLARAGTMLPAFHGLETALDDTTSAGA